MMSFWIMCLLAVVTGVTAQVPDIECVSSRNAGRVVVVEQFNGPPLGFVEEGVLRIYPADLCPKC
jgi:hypothetical protein